METRSLIRNSEFATDVYTGLQASPKYLKSKYFYDKKGDALFQEIMKLPEYYLTNCELEILRKHKEEFLQLISPEEHFHLLDLGAGDAAKTKILLKYLVDQEVNFTYCPVDISSNAIEDVSSKLELEIPRLDINGISKEYLEALEQLPEPSRKIILFLGSSIGNFSREETVEFLQQIAFRMKKNDLFLIGFDLKKDPEIILRAYDDSAGITRQFNLNLLHRMNRELGANFDVDLYKHAPYYDAEKGEARSRLISEKDQLIQIPSLDLEVQIKAGEPIHTEVSRKYELQEIEQLAATAGFEVITNLMDSRTYFTDSVWRIKP